MRRNILLICCLLLLVLAACEKEVDMAQLPGSDLQGHQIRDIITSDNTGSDWFKDQDINKWSRFKPIISPEISYTLPAFEQAVVDYRFGLSLAGAYHDLGITLSTSDYTNISWEYNRPNGTSPMRSGDFRMYNKDARKACGIIMPTKLKQNGSSFETHVFCETLLDASSTEIGHSDIVKLLQHELGNVPIYLGVIAEAKGNSSTYFISGNILEGVDLKLNATPFTNPSFQKDITLMTVFTTILATDWTDMIHLSGNFKTILPEETMNPFQTYDKLEIAQIIPASIRVDTADNPINAYNAEVMMGLEVTVIFTLNNPQNRPIPTEQYRFGFVDAQGKEYINTSDEVTVDYSSFTSGNTYRYKAHAPAVSLSPWPNEGDYMGDFAIYKKTGNNSWAQIMRVDCWSLGD